MHHWRSTECRSGPRICGSVGWGEDAVQLVLEHATQCSEDQEGFDIYQVLALRYYDNESRSIRDRKPLKRIGIQWKFMSISPFAISLFMGIVVALAQAAGTSIVIWKLMYPYLLML